ncbi:hypothetical protein [Natrarchaeobius oligotrophus]|uniref:DUF8147 domain-containing protein n=1 Tax=Natrarchaeobius chitinivorans TaxID=1679083 RepID=A0A3N6MAZ9_NATCH|nr:hypothetical protein [Natrarchaeobius chitinivorans]RQH00959.1 hypothetical protein EA472_10090 [Natrarchaeobius chitinivorans]
MSLKTGIVALVAGLAAFFAVGMGVTAVTVHWIDFPLVLGLMAGTVAGLAVTIVATIGLEEGVPPRQRRTAGVVVGFGVGFVGGAFGGASLEPIGTLGAVGIGVIVGFGLAAAGYALSASDSG